jgi:pimeloyl-ACP methyl ester carboxylesterase
VLPNRIKMLKSARAERDMHGGGGTRPRVVCLALGALLLACAFAGRSEPIPAGNGQRTLSVSGTTIEIHSYKPGHYEGGPLLITLHGLNRNAAGYLGHSRPLADRYGLLVIAPRFDRERFPTWRYQGGGIARYGDPIDSRSLQLEPESQWTARLLIELIERIRVEENRPDLPYYLLGHSAGAQLLSRFAAFVPNAARRIVIANPSTYLWPTRDIGFPYGFGALPDALGNDEAIRRYLAQPVTIFLGTADVTRGANLNVSESAMRQGPNRYQRGLRVFHTAREVAHDKGWAFNWRLVEAPSVGHSARRMYSSPQVEAAFFAK